jgi:excisionase family DNA binding protein
MTELPRLLTLLEVAAQLRLSPHTIRAMVRRGRLHPVRICRRLLFNPADIERLVAESTAARVR